MRERYCTHGSLLWWPFIQFVGSCQSTAQSLPTPTCPHLPDRKSQICTLVHNPSQICPASLHLSSPICSSKALTLAHSPLTTLASSLQLKRVGVLLIQGTCTVPGKLSLGNTHCSPLLIFKICVQMSPPDTFSYHPV